MLKKTRVLMVLIIIFILSIQIVSFASTYTLTENFSHIVYFKWDGQVSAVFDTETGKGVGGTSKIININQPIGRYNTVTKGPVSTGNTYVKFTFYEKSVNLYTSVVNKTTYYHTVRSGGSMR